MGRIVREHYPVDKLPDDLRQGLALSGDVRVTVEEIETVGPALKSDAREAEKTRPMTEAALKDLLGRRHPAFSSVEEVNAHVRALRDEWD